MILDRQRKYRSYEIDGVPSNFSDAPDGTKVSPHAFHTVFSLTGLAGGLWSLYGLQGILLRRKPLC